MNMKRKRGSSSCGQVTSDEFRTKRKFKESEKPDPDYKLRFVSQQPVNVHSCSAPVDSSHIIMPEPGVQIEGQQDETFITPRFMDDFTDESTSPSDPTDKEEFLAQADESEENWSLSELIKDDKLNHPDFWIKDSDEKSRSRPRMKDSTEKSGAYSQDFFTKGESSYIGLYQMPEAEQMLKMEPLRSSSRSTLSESDQNVLKTKETKPLSSHSRSPGPLDALSNAHLHPIPIENDNPYLSQSVIPGPETEGSNEDYGSYADEGVAPPAPIPFNKSRSICNVMQEDVYNESPENADEPIESYDYYRGQPGIVPIYPSYSLEENVSVPSVPMRCVDGFNTYQEVYGNVWNPFDEDHSRKKRKRKNTAKMADFWDQWDNLLDMKSSHSPRIENDDFAFLTKVETEDPADSQQDFELKEEDDEILESGSLFTGTSYYPVKKEFRAPKPSYDKPKVNQEDLLDVGEFLKKEESKPTLPEGDADTTDLDWQKLVIRDAIPLKFRSEVIYQCEIASGTNGYMLARLRVQNKDGRLGPWLYSFQLFKSREKWKQRMGAFVEHQMLFPQFTQRCARSNRRTKVGFLKVQFRDRRAGKMFSQVTRRDQSNKIKKNSPTVRKSNSLVARFCARIADREILIDLCRSGFTFLYKMFSLPEIQKLGGKFFTLDKKDSRYGPAKLLCVDQLGEFGKDKTELIVAMIYIRSLNKAYAPDAGWHYISCGAKEETSLPDWNTMLSREEGWQYLTGKKFGWVVDAVLIEYERERPKKVIKSLE